MKRVSLHAHTFAGMYLDILKAGRATKSLLRARRLVEGLRNRVREIRRKMRGVRRRPRVFCMEWMDPVFATGHWVPEMVRIAGGVEGLARAGMPSRRIPWSRVVAYRPERLILIPCGLDMDRAERDARALKRRPGWRSIPAVRSGDVHVADGPSYFNGAGPRLVDGIEILASLIHPELFPARRKGNRRLAL